MNFFSNIYQTLIQSFFKRKVDQNDDDNVSQESENFQIHEPSTSKKRQHQNVLTFGLTKRSKLNSGSHLQSSENSEQQPHLSLDKNIRINSSSEHQNTSNSIFDSSKNLFDSVSSVNVLKEINRPFEVVGSSHQSSLRSSIAARNPRSRSQLVQASNERRGRESIIAMMKREAGSSAHRLKKSSPRKTNDETKGNGSFISGLDSNTSTNSSYRSTILSNNSSLFSSKSCFTRALSPSVNSTLIIEDKNNMANKIVIDLTSEDDDSAQREIIKAEVMKLPTINRKSALIQRKSVNIDEILEKQKKAMEEIKKNERSIFKKELEDRIEFNNSLAEYLEKKLVIKEHKPTIKPSYELAPITQEMIKTMNKILSSNKVPLVQIKDTGIKLQDIRTLNPGVWLNDEIINSYMNLIKQRSETRPDEYPKVHCFNSFMYTQLQKKGYTSIRRWTKRVDIFEHTIIMVPIHLGNHWCLIEIRVDDKKILYYDSLGSTNNKCLEIILQYLVDEYKDKKNQLLDSSEWKLLNVPKTELPAQQNAYDCGVFASTYAEHITRESPFNFDQGNMPYFRQKMKYEILTGALLL